MKVKRIGFESTQQDCPNQVTENDSSSKYREEVSVVDGWTITRSYNESVSTYNGTESIYANNTIRKQKDGTVHSSSRSYSNNDGVVTVSQFKEHSRQYKPCDMSLTSWSMDMVVEEE